MRLVPTRREKEILKIAEAALEKNSDLLNRDVGCYLTIASIVGVEATALKT